MAQSVTLYNLPVSCPRDVKAEVALIESALEKFNELYAEPFGIPSRESGELLACESRNSASQAPQEQHSTIRSRTDHLTHAVGDNLFPTAAEFSGGVSGCFIGTSFVSVFLNRK